MTSHVALSESCWKHACSRSWGVWKPEQLWPGSMAPTSGLSVNPCLGVSVVAWYTGSEVDGGWLTTSAAEGEAVGWK